MHWESTRGHLVREGRWILPSLAALGLQRPTNSYAKAGGPSDSAPLRVDCWVPQGAGCTSLGCRPALGASLLPTERECGSEDACELHHRGQQPVRALPALSQTHSFLKTKPLPLPLPPPQRFQEGAQERDLVFVPVYLALWRCLPCRERTCRFADFAFAEF